MPQIVRISLDTPVVPKQLGLKGKSWLLSGASRFEEGAGFFFLVDGVSNEALGEHFSYLEPRSDKSFTLELGVALPDWFPNIKGSPEYCLTVDLEGDKHELCISNTMVRIPYEDETDGKRKYALTARAAIEGAVRHGTIPFVPKDAVWEPTRTMAAMRFEIIGDTAEKAFESHCEDKIKLFIRVLNQCLKVLPFVPPPSGWICSMVYSQASLPPFHFIIQGLDSERFASGWIAIHFGKAVITPRDLDDTGERRLRQYLTGVSPLDDIDMLLHSARVFMDGGVDEYVLLLIVIAAEAATRRFVHSRLLSLGVSKTKLDEYEGDITYSLMLNTYLFALTPENNKPDPQLLGRINRARGLRNDYMHEARPLAKPGEILELYDSTTRFVSYLRGVGEVMAKATTACLPSE